jgi:glycosyltransferase involved in cell wall biosynthesis
MNDTSKFKLAIIVPVYNEEELITDSITKIITEINKKKKSIGLFVVNDGSKDKSKILLERLKKNLDFVLINQINLGYGGAIKTGAKVAYENGYDFGLFMDSDLTNPPQFIIKFFDKIKNNYDLIKADRFLKGSDMSGVEANRRILTIIANIIAKFFFRLDISDYTNGFRAVRLKTFLSMNLKEKHFPIILEEMYHAKKLNLKIGNIETTLTSRDENAKKSSFNYDFYTIKNYLKYCFKSFSLNDYLK